MNHDYYINDHLVQSILISYASRRQNVELCNHSSSTNHSNIIHEGYQRVTKKLRWFSSLLLFRRSGLLLLLVSSTNGISNQSFSSGLQANLCLHVQFISHKQIFFLVLLLHLVEMAGLGRYFISTVQWV